jgi:hypothetical protein
VRPQFDVNGSGGLGNVYAINLRAWSELARADSIKAA